MDNKRLIKLAFRNVRRNKKRTLLTFLSIMVGIAAFLVSSALINGIDETSLRNYIRSDTAHIKLYEKLYFPDKKELYLENLIEDPLSIEKAVLSVNPSMKTAPRLKMRGSLVHNDQEIPCIIMGIDPEKDRKVFNLMDSLIQPAENGLEAFNQGTNVCLIGYKLAEVLGLSPGDEVMVYGRTVRSAYNADSFTIQALVACDYPLIDAFSVVLRMDEAQKFADTRGAVSELSIINTTREMKNLQPLLMKIEKAVPEHIGIYSWRDELSEVLFVFRTRQIVQKIVVFFLLVLAIAGITNTMLMAVFERTKEIGTLAAMGMKRGAIEKLFLFEGIIIGLIGGIVAMVVTSIPVALLINVGIEIRSAEITNVPVSSRIFGYLPFYYYLIALALSVAASAFASLYPSMKAARLNIAEILRGK